MLAQTDLFSAMRNSEFTSKMLQTALSQENVNCLKALCSCTRSFIVHL